MRELNNKLIAEFMGGIPSSVPNLINLPQTIGEANIFSVKGSEGLPNGTYNVERIDDLKYHTSWDWLMPVVEKIELLGYTFEKNFQPIDKDWQCLIVKGNDILYQEFNTDSLIACHYVVIEFIKWYNKKASKMIDNKLIAEYMDLEMEVSNKGIVEYYHAEFDSGEWYEAEYLPYDEWNWLMPVVSKILTNENYPALTQRENIMDSLPYGMIKDTYNEVVKFIKWYNEQK